MRQAILASLAAATLAGCASGPVFEGGRAWKDGWREGSVEKVANGSELGFRHTHDCRYRDGLAGRAAVERFAVVGVSMGKHRHHVVPVEPGKEPEVGAPVLSNWRSCEPPIVRAGR